VVVRLRPLDSTSFGFQTDCFVCHPDNPRGLHIPFFHDDEAGVVRAEFTLGADFSGAPRFVHGGLVLTLLDEAMAWAVVAIAERFGVVRTSSAGFRRPVRIDAPHRVEAVVEEQTDRSIATWAQVLDADGRRCAQAKARFAILSEETARAAIGSDLGASARYLRGGTA
jgi:acyl-coenzyme A thioesterase PaaI-like protein